MQAQVSQQRDDLVDCGPRRHDDLKRDPLRLLVPVQDEIIKADLQVFRGFQLVDLELDHLIQIFLDFERELYLLDCHPVSAQTDDDILSTETTGADEVVNLAVQLCRLHPPEVLENQVASDSEATEAPDHRTEDKPLLADVNSNCRVQIELQDHFSRRPKSPYSTRSSKERCIPWANEAPAGSHSGCG